MPPSTPASGELPIERLVIVDRRGRLDEALGLSRRALEELQRRGRVRSRSPGERFGRAVLIGRPWLEVGDSALILEAGVDPGTLPEDLRLPVLWDDGALCFVDKPPRLVMGPGPKHPAGTLANALRALPGPLSAVEGPHRPGIVHRLDRDTSGVLVVARSDETHRALARQFRRHTVARRYLALVVGRPGWSEERIESTLRRRRPGRKAFASHDQGPGRRAVTALTLLAAGDDVALIEARPESGRQHQIRVHLQALGHPVVGDSLYGGPPARALAGRLGLPRIALHALELAVDHPNGGARIVVAAPLPEGLRQALARGGIDPASAILASR